MGVHTREELFGRYHREGFVASSFTLLDLTIRPSALAWALLETTACRQYISVTCLYNAARRKNIHPCIAVSLLEDRNTIRIPRAQCLQ